MAQAFNPTLALEGVLLTMYDDRTNLSQQVTENLQAFFGEKLLTTTIPRNIRLAEAPSHGKPIQLYDPRSKGAEAYTALAAELLRRNGIVSPKAQKQQNDGDKEHQGSSPVLALFEVVSAEDVFVSDQLSAMSARRNAERGLYDGINCNPH